MLTNCTQIALDIRLRKSQHKWDGMASKHTNSLIQKISHQNFLSKTFVLLKKISRRMAQQNPGIQIFSFKKYYHKSKFFFERFSLNITILKKSK